MLRLGDNPFGKGGLAAIAAPGAFPELTTLSLKCYHTRKGKPKELAGWLSSLQLPNLRHLNLMGWPLGNEGAKALAENPAFAGLTRLTSTAARSATQAQRHLRFAASSEPRRVADGLQLDQERRGCAAKKTVMPRLGECWLSSNRIPKKAAAKLKRDGLDLST